MKEDREKILTELKVRGRRVDLVTIFTGVLTMGFG